MNLAVLNSSLAGMVLLVMVVAIIVGFAIGLTIDVCIIWLVSKLVMPATGTFRNAWRFLGWMFLLSIGAMVVFGVFGFIAAATLRNSGTTHAGLLLAGLGVFEILVIVMAFRITMYVYEVSFLRALGFHVVFFAAWLCLMFGNIALQEKFNPGHMAAQRAQTKELVQRLRALMEHKSTASEQAETSPPSATALPGTSRSLLAEATITESIEIPAIINGTNAGNMTLQPGTRVKLISVVGDQLKIQYMDTVTMIPRKSTDYKSDETP